MAFAPQQDWQLFDELTRVSNAQWFRHLTADERYSLYRDFFNVIWAAKRQQANQKRLERWNWNQKLALRRRMVEAFTKLDQVKRERSSTNDTR